MQVTLDAWAWIPTTGLTLVQRQALKATLTIHPRKVGDHPGEAPGPIRLFTERGDLMGVPRAYFLDNQKQRNDITYNVTEGRKDLWAGPIKFSGTLRPEQTKAVQEVVARLRGGALGGIIRAVPGWGKTVVACAIAAELGVPVLVVVHKEFLVNQWKERIEQFLPGAKVGIVQQDTCQFQGQHIAIGMVHSLAGRDYGPVFYEWPGLVVTDEVHRIGAETWSAVPAKFAARWRLGFSATPRRKDGADPVFHHHIGQVIFAAREVRMKPKIRRVWTNFRLVKTDRFNPSLVSKAILLRFLCAADGRNKLIIDQLLKAIEAGRKIIVLSERLQHLKTLENMLRRSWTMFQGQSPSIGYYIGGMSEDALETSSGCQVILATSQLVSEGLDIPALDTMFLTTPLSDVEQAVGRILRPCEGKKDPIVVDFRDDAIPQFARLAETRDRLYQRIA